MKALGVHVFAGGFTAGVMRKMDVVAQLEIHNFGRDTVEKKLKLPFINADRWEDWPLIKDCDLIFGNPRCTGFSCITAGQGENTHGPWAKQTKDVHDFCRYVAAAQPQVAVWESVQQAFTVGRPLLDYIRDEIIVPAGYRIAHLFINSAMFGNSQNRRRYFFVAYKRNLKFNAEVPKLPKYKATLTEAIALLASRKTNEARLGREGEPYNADSSLLLSCREAAVVPHLATRQCLNNFAKTQLTLLREVCPKYADTYETRISERPFSMHCIRRLDWDRQCPTLHSSCSRLIHPDLNRALTVRELATIMGWSHVPVGDLPVCQIVKGVVPAVGQWLAEQVEHSLNKDWSTDWETKYNHHTGYWDGQYTEADEKIIDMTHYYPKIRRIDDDVQKH